MKVIFSLWLIIFCIVDCSFVLAKSDGKCGCDSFPEITGRVDCNPIKFSNGAQIYWKITCNGSKLIFQKGKIKRIIYFLDKNEVDLTGRLGYRYFDEYKNSIRVEDKESSRTGWPYNDILLNKNTGKIIADLGYSLYASDSKKYPPFLLNLKNLNTLILTSLDNNKRYYFPLPKGRLARSLKQPDGYYPSTGIELFEDITLRNGILKIVYNYYDAHLKQWKKSIYPINVAVLFKK